MTTDLNPNLNTPLPTADSKARWGQERRLAFIDLRLQYDGKIRRGDLKDYFGISIQQASQDLSQYQILAPGNMCYDSSSKTYVSTDEFFPRYGQPYAEPYLNEIQAIATGVLNKDQSFLGYLPPTGLVATPSRALGAEKVANIVEAMRDKRSLEIEYQSMRAPIPAKRVISPHALGYDGLRWHVRAYCHSKQLFRDFAIGRIRNLWPSDAINVGSETDVEWNTIVTIKLAPHPELSPDQRKMVAEDYGMNPDETLDVACRQAMLFYTLRHLNLDSSEILSDPARQHVYVVNRDDVEAWLQDVSIL